MKLYCKKNETLFVLARCVYLDEKQNTGCAVSSSTKSVGKVGD